MLNYQNEHQTINKVISDKLSHLLCLVFVNSNHNGYIKANMNLSDHQN